MREFRAHESSGDGVVLVGKRTWLIRRDGEVAKSEGDRVRDVRAGCRERGKLLSIGLRPTGRQYGCLVRHDEWLL